MKMERKSFGNSLVDNSFLYVSEIDVNKFPALHFNSRRPTWASSTVLFLVLGAILILGGCASLGHIDNSPCTYPYALLDDSARLAIYEDEHGTIIARELIASDAIPSPSEPSHYWVRGRCYVQLQGDGSACTAPTPYACKVGNQSWCSKVKC